MYRYLYEYRYLYKYVVNICTAALEHSLLRIKRICCITMERYKCSTCTGTCIRYSNVKISLNNGVYNIIYRVVVQSVICIAESFVFNKLMIRKLNRFHRRCAHYIGVVHLSKRRWNMGTSIK